MRRVALLAVAAGLFLPALASAPAHAQATRTWVSGVGDDANPCSRTAPCKTFAGAISKTAAAGEIDCLDPGGFGAITITKSITISCRVQDGGILSAGTNGVIINALSTDTVILKGVDIQGAGTGLNGIRILAAGQVVVQDSNISGVTQIGISHENSSLSRLVIKNVTITNATTAGVRLRPTAAVAGAATIEGLTVAKAGVGLQLDSGGGGTAVIAEVRDSSFSNATTAGVQLLGSSAVQAMLTRVSAFQNPTGLSAAAGTQMRVGSSVITNNTTGVSGTISSFGTNQLFGNNTDGTLTLLSPALK